MINDHKSNKSRQFYVEHIEACESPGSDGQICWKPDMPWEKLRFLGNQVC